MKFDVVSQTAVKWVSDDLFFAACSSAPRIHLWNVEGKIASKFLYEMEKGKEAARAQINQLEVMKDKKMLLGGCEDGFVRIFDLSTGKIIKKLESRASVSCVLGWEWTIVSGDHSGCVSTWDTRMLRLIEEREDVHLNKYDAGVTCLSRVESWLLTSGADGMVKMFI